MKIHIFFLFLFVLDLYIGQCQCACPSLSGSTAGYQTVTYNILPDNENVVNPGRGFYKNAKTKTSSFNPLWDTFLGSNHNVLLRLYYLDLYIHNDTLPISFFDKIKADLNLMYKHGWTCILRFAYTDKNPKPYDTHPARVLKHIDQLASHGVFQTHNGIIAAVQEGFIGLWGEGHNTSHEFGVPLSCKKNGMILGLNVSQWTNRNNVLKKLLQVVPVNIDIQVRIPVFKYHYSSLGHNFTTLDDSRKNNDRSRIGFHNDAFLSDDRNQGTFVCDNDKNYMAEDSKYTVVAGETDYHKNASTYSCSVAQSEMKKYHYSMLNEDYDTIVIKSWKDHRCFKTIAAKLGYRLYATHAYFPSNVAAGGSMCFSIEIQSDGYAAPYKDLDVYIYLQKGSTTIKSSKIYANTHAWLPDTKHTLTGQISIPHEASGDYKVYLVIVDSMLRDESKYFILLANQQNHHPPSTRLNDMQFTVHIGASGSMTNTGFLMGASGTGINTGSSTGSSQGCSKITLQDGSFENNAAGWHKLNGGFHLHTGSPSSAEDGRDYITVTDGGAYQTLDFSSSPAMNFTISGYSRHSSTVTVSNPDDYSIYCDLQHADSSATYGIIQKFEPSSSANGKWQQKVLHVTSTKPIVKALCYAMFRNGHGSVDFDNFQITPCLACAVSLSHGSFDSDIGWSNYSDGYTRQHSTSSAQDGSYYIRVTNGAANQHVDFHPPVYHFTLSGWSRCNSCHTSNPNDYSVYCDLTYDDGKPDYGKTEAFSTTSSHTWHKETLRVTTSKLIARASCYTMFRRGSGSADFDNFVLESCG